MTGEVGQCENAPLLRLTLLLREYVEVIKVAAAKTALGRNAHLISDSKSVTDSLTSAIG
jgi:hypothetical protein